MSIRDDYQALWSGHEPPEFLAWLPSVIGLPEDFNGRLGEMNSYWIERQAALNGWLAASHPGMSWPEVLAHIGYSERAARYLKENQ